MTYLQLLQRIQLMPTERLHDTVTVYDPYEDEYIAVIGTDVCLDHNHLYLILNSIEELKVT
jgi:hypothetical protein